MSGLLRADNGDEDDDGEEIAVRLLAEDDNMSEGSVDHTLTINVRPSAGVTTTTAPTTTTVPSLSSLASLPATLIPTESLMDLPPLPALPAAANSLVLEPLDESSDVNTLDSTVMREMMNPGYVDIDVAAAAPAHTAAQWPWSRTQTPQEREFAGGSFYDTDDYVNDAADERARGAAAPPAILDSEPSRSLTPPAEPRGSGAVVGGAGDELFAPFVSSNTVRGDYAAISLVAGDDASSVATQYQRIRDDDEMEAEFQNQQQQQQQGQSQQQQRRPAARTMAGAYIRLPPEDGDADDNSSTINVNSVSANSDYDKISIVSSSTLRRSVTEASGLTNNNPRRISEQERAARQQYGELPNKEELVRIKSKHQRLDAANKSLSAGPGARRQLQRRDRRNLPSMSTMRNGDIACEQCRAGPFMHKVRLENGRVHLLCHACYEVRRAAQERSLQNAYAAMPIDALRAQRASTLDAIAQLDARFGARQKDAGAVQQLAQLRLMLEDTENELARRAATASTSTATAAFPVLGAIVDPTSTSPARANMYASPNQATALRDFKQQLVTGTVRNASPLSPAPPPPPVNAQPAPIGLSDTLYIERFGTLEMAQFARDKSSAALEPAKAAKANKTFIVKSSNGASPPPAPPPGAASPTDARQFAPSLGQLSAAKARSRAASPPPRERDAAASSASSTAAAAAAATSPSPSPSSSAAAQRPALAASASPGSPRRAAAPATAAAALPAAVGIYQTMSLSPAPTAASSAAPRAAVGVSYVDLALSDFRAAVSDEQQRR